MFGGAKVDETLVRVKTDRNDLAAAMYMRSLMEV